MDKHGELTEASSEKKCILILTADAGFGHRSAANAVAAALSDLYGEQVCTEIINPLDDERTPFFLRDSQADYDTILHHAPELYRLGYDFSDGTITSAIVESALTVLLFEVLRDIIRKHNPSAILTTYPLYHTPLAAIATITNQPVPVLTAVTDLVTVHKLWFNENVTACFVPTEQVRQLALENDIPAEKIHITGIPVHPRISAEKRDKAAVRSELGWRIDLPTFLAVGSRRVDGLLDTLNVLNHFGAPLQLAVVAGKDELLYSRLREIDWHVPAHIYEFVDNMPTLMRAADALISKAGGLIVTEAMASGLPMMLIDVLPGQEEGNAVYVTENGAADLAEEPLDVLEITAHWLMDGAHLLKTRAENAVRIGRPLSAYEIARITWQAAHSNTALNQDLQSPPRQRMIELLNKYKIKWQDSLLNNPKR